MSTTRRVSAAIAAWLAPLAGTCLAGAALAQGLSPTTGTGIGIFYQPGAPAATDLWQEGDPGRRLQLRGRVLDTRGAPVAGALVELWHADGTGSVDETRYRSALRTAADGSFGVRTVLPGHIELARYNDVWGARHIHLQITHPAHPRLVSLVYFKGDERLPGTPYPELAIALEEARVGEETLLFGQIEIVLR